MDDRTDQLLPGEDLEIKCYCTRSKWIERVTTHINGDEMNLCVTVLSGLGGRHIDDLARASYASRQI